jgi:hypothetical protein
VPVNGVVDALLKVSDGSFTGNTKLADTKAKLQAAYFLPLQAWIGFSEVGQTTGSLVDKTLTANTKQLIALKRVKLFGIDLVANTCATSKPSDITLKSAKGAFAATAGGTISGTFAIAPLKNCGALNAFVSGLSAGGNNTISVKLTPKS